MTWIAGRVFVVDDDPHTLSGLDRCLSIAGFDVRTFPSAESFLESGPIQPPACVVLDHCLRGVTGLELQDQLSTDLSLSVVFVTASRDIQTVVQAMKRGAVDFLTKPVDRDALLSAVERAMERSVRADAERQARDRFATRLLRLTPREHQVVQGVVRGLRNKQIAFELGTTEKTIKVHRSRAMEKLEMTSVAELARVAEQTQTLVPRACSP